MVIKFKLRSVQLGRCSLTREEKRRQSSLMKRSLWRTFPVDFKFMRTMLEFTWGTVL